MDIIFDIGNVLVRWNLHAGFDDHFADPADLAAYLDGVGFAEWNARADAGQPWADLVAELIDRHGEAAYPAVLYPDRHPLTIKEPIEASWALVDRLAAAGHGLYALTNWSAESFPHAVTRHPRLDRFRDIVVSGREGVTKPDPAIFRVLLDRNGLDLRNCLFIDDSAANVAGAAALGMDAVRFTDPESLERDLALRGLL